MTPTESKMRILAEWRIWVGHREAADSHTTKEVAAFLDEMESSHPELLSFESSSGKWEIVPGWLLGAGLISPA